MAETYKELQEKINQLQDVIDGKDLQARVIENDMVDILSASTSSSEITMLILQIMSELLQHVKKKGWTALAKASQARLNRLLELAVVVEKATNENYRLKLINRDLHANYQLLRVENRDMKNKLQSIKNAEEF